MRSVFTSPGGEPSIYLAWREVQRLSRLAANPVFISLGGFFIVREADNTDPVG